jgi:two-component system, OmpR family, sensor histidine kinase KdpD
MRSPLIAINAAVGALRERNLRLSAQDMDELLAVVDQPATFLAGLVDNLLDSSRLVAGAVRPVVRPVEWSAVVSRALVNVGDRHLVEAHIDDALPTVLADGGLLERVVANVVDNALRHSRPSQAPDRSQARSPVVLTAGCIGSDVQLNVIDHGPGMPAATLPRLFVPFQRVGERPSSVGIGLSVAKGFVELMGGAIEGHETPGDGLTVVIVLPAARSDR